MIQKLTNIDFQLTCAEIAYFATAIMINSWGKINVMF